MPDGFGLASLGDGAEVIVRADTCLGDRDDDEAGHDLADVHTRYSEAGPWGAGPWDTPWCAHVPRNGDRLQRQQTAGGSGMLVGSVKGA